MKTFSKPKNLNGTELILELKNAGLTVQEITDNGNGEIYFETDNADLAAEIVAAHNGTTVALKPTIEDKLASVGLSVNDLKTVLGL